MLTGLPIACTAVGGVPEVVNGAGCLLPDDEGSYARGLRDFLSDDDALRSAAGRAAARAAAWPDRVEIARRHRALYADAPQRHGIQVTPVDSLFL